MRGSSGRPESSSGSSQSPLELGEMSSVIDAEQNDPLCPHDSLGHFSSGVLHTNGLAFDSPPCEPRLLLSSHPCSVQAPRALISHSARGGG